MKPQLIIKDLRKDRTTSGTIHGTIYWKFGATCFPDRDWDDFAGVLLGWWRTELFVKARRRRNFTLEFMDGPMSIKGIHVYKNDYIIKLMNAKKVMGIYYVSTKELITAFRRAEMSFKVKTRMLKYYTTFRI
jgi:hypothetical protein